jgi:hypothetical protein
VCSTFYFHIVFTYSRSVRINVHFFCWGVDVRSAIRSPTFEETSILGCPRAIINVIEDSEEKFSEQSSNGTIDSNANHRDGSGIIYRCIATFAQNFSPEYFQDALISSVNNDIATDKITRHRHCVLSYKVRSPNKIHAIIIFLHINILKVLRRYGWICWWIM